MEELPTGCTYLNSTSIDKGQCESNPCYSGSVTECTNIHTHCCGETGIETVYAECEDGAQLPVYIVTSCGCTLCSQEAKITVVGLASSRNGTALRYGTIYFNGENVANTTETGEFSFEADRGVQRATVLFVDTHDKYFMDNSYVFEMPTGNQDSVSIRVYLLPRGNVTTISATQESTLSVGDTEVIIPENAFYTQDGQLYEVKQGWFYNL